jgi:HPt (histidine-containing phosphotransfer) domain-containing protein
VRELTPEQRQQLEALRHAYGAELAQKVGSIAEVAASLGSRVVDRTRLQDLHQLTHRLAGSSAIFGFDTISRTARELEELTAAALQSRVDPGANVRARVDRRVNALQQALLDAAGPKRERGRADRRDRRALPHK